MSINGINNSGNIKFGEDTGLSVEREAEVKSWIDKLEDRIDMLDELDQYSSNLSLERQAEAKFQKARVEAMIGMLEVYIETGEFPTIANIENEDWYQNLANLESGLHGDFIKEEHDSAMFVDYAAQIAAREEEFGELAEVICVPAASDNTEISPAIVLAITDADDVEAVYGRTVGEDIWLTVETPDGKKTYVLEGLATRTDITIAISAEGCTKPVVIDMSQAVRINTNPDGLNNSLNIAGFILIGGKGDDKITGSQSSDLIVGNEGNDTLLGMGGWDQIYGDTTFKNALNDEFHSINDNASGGRDFIDGGHGFDTIYGGGNRDTVVRDTQSKDSISEAENFIEMQDTVNQADLDALTANANITGWEIKGYNEDTGEVTMERTDADASSAIDLTAPPGYTMAYAANEDNDIIVTFVKMTTDIETGLPKSEYLRIRIKNFNRVTGLDQQTHLTIKTENKDDIIDFSDCNIGQNKLTINGQNGNDILLGARSNLDDIRANMEDLRTMDSSISTAQMRATLDPSREGLMDGRTTWGGDFWTNEGQDSENGITLRMMNNISNAEINFTKPEGLEEVNAVYYEIAENGEDIIVYMIDSTNPEEGEFNLVKVRIVGGAREGAIASIAVDGKQAELLGGTVFTDGEGDDLMVGNYGSTLNWGDNTGNDTTVKSWGKSTWDNSNQGIDRNKNSDEDAAPDWLEIQEGTDPNDGTSVPEGFDPAEPEADPA